jgi:hypothetical protein
MRGIIALSKRRDATADSVLRVGRLLHDTAEYDSTPGAYTFPFPKFVPTVQRCAEFFLPEIAKVSPKALRDVVQSLPSMSPGERAVAVEVLGRIGVAALARVLVALEDNELASICSALRELRIPEIGSLLEAFSALSGDRAQKVVACLASEGGQVLASFAGTLSDLGITAMPFLRELIRFNACNPHSFRFAWQVGLAKAIRHGTIKYLTALEAISVLERLGADSSSVLSETAQSGVAKIQSASRKAMQRVKSDARGNGTGSSA